MDEIEKKPETEQPETSPPIGSDRDLEGGRRNGSRQQRRGAAATQQGIGGALRSVYDEAMEEAVPQEMLDLLGKLG